MHVALASRTEDLQEDRHHHPERALQRARSGECALTALIKKNRKFFSYVWKFRRKGSGKVIDSVPDPDPPDPRVFEPPGSGSISQRNGSGTGSESISQRHRSADPDPDPHQNVIDPEHWS